MTFPLRYDLDVGRIYHGDEYEGRPYERNRTDVLGRESFYGNLHRPEGRFGDHFGIQLPGEKIKVDTGNIAFFEAGVGYSSEMVKGFANILFGGEGLFLSTLTGPGKVWLQTMSVSELAKRIIPFIPSSK